MRLSRGGATLGTLGAGWAEPGSAGLFGLPTAIEPRVLLLEDLPAWPDEKGAMEQALRFGARLDLAFGGPGKRHLDHAGPEQGEVQPDVVIRTAGGPTGRWPW